MTNLISIIVLIEKVGKFTGKVEETLKLHEKRLDRIEHNIYNEPKKN